MRMIWRAGNINVADNGNTAFYAGQGILELYQENEELTGTWTIRISGSDRSGIDFHGGDPAELILRELAFKAVFVEDGIDYDHDRDIDDFGGVLEDIFSLHFENSMEFEIRQDTLRIRNLPLPEDTFQVTFTRQELRLLADLMQNNVKNKMTQELYEKLERRIQ